MTYLCLIYSDENRWQRLRKAETDKMMGEVSNFTDSIKASGHYLGSNRLQPTPAATTGRIRDPKPSTTAGPFAERRQQRGGYYLVEAPDLNDAIRIASKIPSARFGSIEVRPIWEVVRP